MSRVCKFYQRKVLRFLDKSSAVNENEDGEGSEDNLEPTANTSGTSIKITPILRKLNFNSFTEWTIKNCNGPKSATEFMKIKENIDDLNKIENTLLIKIIVDGGFNKPKPHTIDEFSKICGTKSVIAFFMSKNYENFFIYWKSKEIEYFLTLKAFENAQSIDYKELYGFIADFLIDSLINGRLGLQKGTNHSQLLNEIDISQLADPYNYNLLQLSAELGEVETVRILLNMRIIKDSPSTVGNAQSLAQNGQHYDVLMILLLANFTYPLNFDVNTCPEDIRNFVKIGEELHDHIKSRNSEKILDILTNNPKQLHYYNLSNESALKAALDKKLFTMYELLLSHNVAFASHENFNEIFGKLSEDERYILRRIHFKYSKDLPEKHMNILMMNTFISHDEDKTEDKEAIIRRAYSALNKDPILSVILRTVAASRRFETIFDFKRDSVQLLDPTADSLTRGLFYTSGRIYIGAKQLLDVKTEHETFGTLAHELSHHAINLTYRNRSKPYGKNDKATKEEYKKIVEICKEKCQNEEIVRLVYETYTSEFQHAELIVRVPHLLALYHKNQEKLEEVREIFELLFKFFMEHVIPNMEAAIPAIKTKAEKAISKNDNLISKLTRNILFLLIISCTAGGFLIFFTYDPTYIFNELSSWNQISVKNALVDYKNIEVRFTDLFDDSSGAYEKLSSNHIKQLLDQKVLKLSDPHLYYLEELVYFNWLDAPENIKLKVFDSEVNFQNHTIKFEALSLEALNYLTFEDIVGILEGKILTLGVAAELETEFYVQRKFIPENAKLIFFKYKYGLEDEDDFDSFEEFGEDFLAKSFDEHWKILSDVKNQVYYKFNSQFYDLNDKVFTFMHKNSDEIIRKARKDRIFVLSSEAGAGKTVTFENIALEFKINYPTEWVSYIDLKDFTKLFNRRVKLENILGLLEEILRLGSINEFERQVFEDLYISGRVVLVWNGFDEISPGYSEFVLNLVKNIHENTKNVQFLCTRTLCSDQLSTGLKVNTWQLVPFIESEQKNFIKEYFLSQNIEESEIPENIKRVQKIIAKLNYYKNAVRNFNTPLMLRLVAEVHEEHNLQENLYGIYQAFVQKKLEIWVKRGDSAHSAITKIIQLPKFNMMEIFQKYALLNGIITFISSTLVLKIKNLEIIRQIIPPEIPYEEISRMGIVYINGENKFEFAHRTFAEFFIAQYFIQNVYMTKENLITNEAILRLECFLILTERYGSYQRIITDFMISYLENVDSRRQVAFNPEISNLLRTKFSKSFIYMIDTDHPEIYEFLFKFFKKDHGLLIDLLQVNEKETLYTEIFNPNNFAFGQEPENILKLARSYLTDQELNRFINGTHQKGKILYGMKFYEMINVNKVHESYKADRFLFKSGNLSFGDFQASFSKNNDSENITQILPIWQFIYNIKDSLTIPEQIQLFMTILSPKIYLVYNKLFNTADFVEYVKIWDTFVNKLSLNDIKIAIGTALIDYCEIFPPEKPEKDFFLNFLLEKAQKYLNSTQILEIFQERNILHEAHWDLLSFKTFWNFLSNHTTQVERRDILLRNDADDKSFYLYFSISDAKNSISSHYHAYSYYDHTPFKIFHRALSLVNAPTFDFTVKVYEEYFNRTELQDIIRGSNDFMYYTIGIAGKEPFKKFVGYLWRVFDDNQELLRNYLDQKIEPTKLSVFEFMEDFSEIAGSQSRWFDNLHVLYELYNRTGSN